MILDLKSIFACEGAVLPIDYEIDLSNTEYEGGFPLKTPVKVKGSISNKASVVTLDISVEYEFSANCDRCGASTVRKHTVNINRSLATSIEGEESDTIIPVPDMKFDVDEFVFDEVYLSLPMKHLCRQTCKGICDICGKNLNEADCGCKRKEIDPRLAKLAELLENQ